MEVNDGISLRGPSYRIGYTRIRRIRQKLEHLLSGLWKKLLGTGALPARHRLSISRSPREKKEKKKRSSRIDQGVVMIRLKARGSKSAWFIRVETKGDLKNFCNCIRGEGGGD